MHISQFDYDLPEQLIAQTPLERRDESRLMGVSRASNSVEHHQFRDLPQLLQPGDLLVLNDTKVLPVRLVGKKSTGGKVEILLTKRLLVESKTEQWEALTKPGLQVGQQVVVEKNGHKLTIDCQQELDYIRVVRIGASGEQLLTLLHKLGTLPTPPYIKEFVGDPQRYQTIFARRPGSAAAPTAGLHFTPKLLSQLKDRGINTTHITLHVGLGTFLPVKSEDPTKHQMHSEWFEVSTEAAQQISHTKKFGHRVIAVGTTSLRTLESAVDESGQVQAGAGETNIFIYPPYRFRITDALITNFHLPRSTLLMLVSAFVSFPQSEEEFVDFQSSLIGRAYREAVAQRYRFFSFGDAMLIE